VQVLLADHEVLQDQIVTVEMSNQRLINSNEQLTAEVAWYRIESEKVCVCVCLWVFACACGAD
jgi:hypothetical protein